MFTKPVTADIRRSMVPIGAKLPDRLYRAVQQLLTEWTGKAPQNIEPILYLRGYHRQGITATGLVTALLATAGIIAVYPAAPLAAAAFPIIWLWTAASLRTAQVSFTHYASHGTLNTRRWLNEFIGEAWSIVGFFEPLWLYRLGHIGGHHGHLNTELDPDAAFFANNGFEPGRSNEWYWRHLITIIFSLKVHARMFAARLKANFLPLRSLDDLQFEQRLKAPSGMRIVSRAVAAAAFHATLVTGAVAYGYGLVYLFGYIVPATIGYQVLSIFQNISEHQPAIVPGQSGNLKGETKYTGARYFGYRYDAGHPARWFAKMLFLALPQKLLTVGPTELQSHNVHHDPRKAIFRMSDNNWAMAPYVARDAVEKHGAEYKETWGLRAALNESFKALATMPARERK